VEDHAFPSTVHVNEIVDFHLQPACTKADLFIEKVLYLVMLFVVFLGPFR